MDGPEMSSTLCETEGEQLLLVSGYTTPAVEGVPSRGATTGGSMKRTILFAAFAATAALTPTTPALATGVTDGTPGAGEGRHRSLSQRRARSAGRVRSGLSVRAGTGLPLRQLRTRRRSCLGRVDAGGAALRAGAEREATPRRCGVRAVLRNIHCTGAPALRARPERAEHVRRRLPRSDDGARSRHA